MVNLINNGYLTSHAPSASLVTCKNIVLRGASNKIGSGGISLSVLGKVHLLVIPFNLMKLEGSKNLHHL